MNTPSQQLLPIALRVLEFRCGLTRRAPTPEECDFLRSQADGELEASLTIDDLACRVVRREVQRVRLSRGREMKSAQASRVFQK